MATAIQPSHAVAAPSEAMPAARSGAASKAFALTLGLRLFYSLVAAFLSPILQLSPKLIYSNGLTGHLLSREAHPWLYALGGVWQRFDTLWYIQIARHGYDRPMSTVFYPLYPALIRAVSCLMHYDLAAALAIATMASFFLFWGALRLFELDYTPETSLWAVALWSSWPSSFMFFAGYADSLLCALLVWSIYFARARKWPVAGILGLLAGCAKALGCFVALPLLWIAWKQRTVRGLLAAAACGVGTGCFQAWLAFRHFPPAAQIYKTYFLTSSVAPWITLFDALRYLAQHTNFLLSLNLITLAIAGAASLSAPVRTEYRTFAIAAICLFLAKHTDPLLQSTTRYSLALFGAWPALAKWFRPGLSLAFLICVCEVFNLLLLRAFLEWGLVV